MVMNPNNGEILAMVNKPDFDPNNPLMVLKIFQVKLMEKSFKDVEK